MKHLSLNELIQVAGGQCDESQEPSTADKARDVLNDGLETIGDNIEKLADKIHDKTDHHNHKS